MVLFNLLILLLQARPRLDGLGQEMIQERSPEGLFIGLLRDLFATCHKVCAYLVFVCYVSLSSFLMFFFESNCTLKK